MQEEGETRPEERISYFTTRVKRLHLSIVQIYGMPMVRGTIMQMGRCCLMFIDCSGYSATGAVYKSNFTLLEQSHNKCDCRSTVDSCSLLEKNTSLYQ